MDSKTFTNHLKYIVRASKITEKSQLEEIRKKVRIAHVKENVALNSENIIDIPVRFDRSWHKRGYNSNYGIGCIIDMLTGYIIDYDILSKICQHCVVSEKALGKNSPEFNIWYKGHESTCDKNFDGSSGAKEIEIAKRL